MNVLVVFDIESDPPMPIGVYLATIEDMVVYDRPRGGGTGRAPADCVAVVAVDPIGQNEQAIADAFTPPDPFSRKA